MYSDRRPDTYALSPAVSATVGLMLCTSVAVASSWEPESPPAMSPSIVTVGALPGVGVGVGVAVGVEVGVGVGVDVGVEVGVGDGDGVGVGVGLGLTGPVTTTSCGR